MAKTLKGRTQHPAYTAAELTAKNPVLLKGEVVYESDTTRHKIGNGTTAWNTLPYAKGDFDGPLAAEKVTQDAGHRFVSDTEKTTWNSKAAKDLSNVTLGKLFSTNGYYKAPDGVMFQWGVSPGGAAQIYFPTSFIATPFICLLSAYYGNGEVITSASYVDVTAQYLRYQSRWSNLSDINGGLCGTAEKVHWLVIGRWK
nr:MAG TPA: hyaluronidase [Caudoviricetes sp.]